MASEGGTQSQKIFSVIKHWPMNVALADEDVPQSQDVTKSQIRVIKNWPLNQRTPSFCGCVVLRTMLIDCSIHKCHLISRKFQGQN